MTKTMMIMTPHNCGVISNAGAFVSLLNVDSPATGSVQSLVLGAENMILRILILELVKQASEVLLHCVSKALVNCFKYDAKRLYSLCLVGLY